MDQRPNVSLENSSKPSKLMALIALVIAIALPFILVKSFSNKQKANYDTEQEQTTQAMEETALPIPPLPKPAVERPDSADRSHSPDLINKRPAEASKPLKDVKPPAPVAAAEVAKTEPKPAKVKVETEKDREPKTILTRRRDSLASVFSRIGLSRQLLQTISKENPRIKPLTTRLRANEKLEYQFKNHTLEKMTIPYSSTQALVLYRDGQHYRSKINPYKITSQNHHVTATVRGSLYTTAKRNNISPKLIQQMTEIFAWDINFARDVRANDKFTIVYRTTMANDKIIGTGEIVAVSYRNRGNTYQAILHTSRSGHRDYYSPKGSSLKNAFNRYPLRFTHISSTFSTSRNHPILRYKRPHKGVDLAAPIGTPIMATGDGRIEIIGRQSGYGNMIKIKHNNTYNSIYGHMLRFQKGLSKGTYVKKGQIIGYVGQSGLATGPHCHYEFHVHQNPRNPTTVDLPRGDSVPAREIANFKANSNRLLSMIKSIESGNFAKANRKGTRVG